MRTITLADVDAFVSNLDNSMKYLWREIQSDLHSRRDTLDDEFQISALLYDVFWDYVERKHNENRT